MIPFSVISSRCHFVFFNPISPVLIRLLFDVRNDEVSKRYRRGIEGISVEIRRRFIKDTLRRRDISFKKLFSLFNYSIKLCIIIVAALGNLRIRKC